MPFTLDNASLIQDRNNVFVGRNALGFEVYNSGTMFSATFNYGGSIKFRTFNLSTQDDINTASLSQTYDTASTSYQVYQYLCAGNKAWWINDNTSSTLLNSNINCLSTTAGTPSAAFGSYSQVGAIPRGIYVYNNDQYMLLTGNSAIATYYYPTPYSYFSYTHQSTVSMGNFFNGLLTGAKMSPDGSKLFVAGRNTGGNFAEIRQYSLSTPYNITTFSYDNVSIVLDYQAYTWINEFKFNDDGTKLFVLDIGGAKFRTYSL